MSGSNQSLRFAALGAAVVIAFSGVAYASSDTHEHGKSEAKLVLDHGKKWPTDAHARQGMENVRAALATDLEAIHAGRQTDAQYRALAGKVNAEVASMVQNCKLEPKADAQFHIVLAELLEGAKTMEGKHEEESARHGAERVARALNDYGRHFQHPGWKRL